MTKIKIRDTTFWKFPEIPGIFKVPSPPHHSRSKIFFFSQKTKWHLCLDNNYNWWIYFVLVTCTWTCDSSGNAKPDAGCSPVCAGSCWLASNDSSRQPCRFLYLDIQVSWFGHSFCCHSAQNAGCRSTFAGFRCSVIISEWKCLSRFSNCLLDSIVTRSVLRNPCVNKPSLAAFAVAK